jgi:glycosyltransferase involved in cell wall biosynthesis
MFFESGRQGGSVFRLLSILERLDRTRFEVGVVSYYADRAAARLFEVAGLACRIRLHVPWYPQPDVFKPVLGLRIPTPFGIYLFVASLFVLWRHRPDVAYMNTGISGFEPAILAARLVGVKVVCHLRMSRALRQSEVAVARYVDHLVTCSQWAAGSYARQVGRRPAATCIYDGIDLSEFDARAAERLGSSLPDGPIYVCQVGSLIARKRPRLAIAALEIARGVVPNLRLVLAGDGPLRAELEAMVRERGLDHDVLFLGHRRDIPALLRRCHAGLLPSTDEGLPNSVMEYMASSLPVIATRLPFIDELIRDGDSGLVIDEVSADAVAEAMVTLARSPEFRERLGRAGRETIEAAAFHPDREASNVEALLEAVVEDRDIGPAVTIAARGAEER